MAKWKLSRIALVFLLTFQTVDFREAHASESSQQFAKDMSEVFLKEQLKKELRSFLNANPRVLNSSDAQVGTKAMQFVGVALSTYNLITAETDKARLYSAAGIGVAFSPEPYSAAVLMAVQMIDMAVSMRHAVKTAESQEEISRIRLRTMAIWEQIFTEDFNRQKRIISGISQTYDEILSIQKRLRTDPVVQYVLGETAVYPSPKQAQAAFVDVGKLHQALLSFRVQRILFDGIVQVDKFEPFRELATVLDEFEMTNKDFIDSVDGLMKSVRVLFAVMQAEKDVGAINKKVGEYELKSQKYVFCANAVNRVRTAYFMEAEISASKELFDYQRLADECVVRFNWSALW